MGQIHPDAAIFTMALIAADREGILRLEIPHDVQPHSTEHGQPYSRSHTVLIGENRYRITMEPIGGDDGRTAAAGAAGSRGN